MPGWADATLTHRNTDAQCPYVKGELCVFTAFVNCQKAAQPKGPSPRSFDWWLISAFERNIRILPAHLAIERIVKTRIRTYAHALFKFLNPLSMDHFLL
jgi:hypothetical protein